MLIYDEEKLKNDPKVNFGRPYQQCSISVMDTIADPDRLETDLRSQVLSLDAEFAERTEYGHKYRICGELTGPNGRRLKVETIWMKEAATAT